MLRYRPQTPIKGAVPGFNTQTMEQALELKYSLRKAKASLVWGLINVFMLAAIIYDLAYKCPLYTTPFNYIEYGLVVVFTLNILYHIVRYFCLVVNVEPVTLTPSEKKLQGKESYFTSNQSTSTTSVLKQIRKRANEAGNELLNDTFNHSYSYRPETPNEFNLSWRNSPNTNISDSQNYSIPSPSWIYYRGSPEPPAIISTSPRNTPTYLPEAIFNPESDSITDEKMLNQYLYEFETQDKVQSAANISEPQNNLLSTFWSHPGTQTHNEVSVYFRKSQYQLAQQNSSIQANNTSGVKDESSPLNIAQRGNEVWKKLGVEPQILTQWNANLRMWISQTILERIISEIDNINEELQTHHLQDVRIGTVGLERLRKTAQTMQAMEYVPTLQTLLPFLEVTAYQEYLVKRLRDLVKGGCMSEYKWCSGSSFNGREWEDSLPTDSAIIMHLLSTYLDSQLLPLPSQPDAKPFSKEHYIKMSEKIPESSFTLAINHVTDKPPHYRLVVGEEVFEVAKGHNNLFHTILLFLYYVNQKEQGMLGKVNMGKPGVNMLWIIDC